MRSFASDNNSGVHPLVMEAISKANTDHAVGYGDDPWTARAIEILKNIFGEKASPFLVFNGTGANTVALQAVTRSYHSILCAATGHIYVDECGGPVKLTGCTIVPLRTTNGKITPEMIEPHLHNIGVCHHSQPKVAYISQTTELGTVYTVKEIRTLANFLHAHDMYLHMDGARLANACISTGATMKEMTVDAGVDIVSLGGTKNGMMMGEVVISFREELNDSLPFLRKQSAQLASKQRFLAAQFVPYFENGIWETNARAAHESAMRLAAILKQYPQICFTQPIESNQLFFTIPAEAAKKLSEKYFFYYWNEAISEIRLVTSWDTSEEDLNQFEASLKEVLV